VDYGVTFLFHGVINNLQSRLCRVLGCLDACGWRAWSLFLDAQWSSFCS